MDTRDRLPAHMQLLLGALADPGRCGALSEPALDVLVRSARAARLLGVLAARVDKAGALHTLPQCVADHLRAAAAQGRHGRQMVLRQLAIVEETLRPLQLPLVALKGSAYILRRRSCADGRLVGDVDILVPHERLMETEQALTTAGWAFTKTDPHDQRYYREWSHELPPMRAQTMPYELDVHHAILPPLGRLKPDTALLLSAAVPVGDGWLAPDDADLVLHASAHLFQDSDCAGRVRDLVDIDSLVRDAVASDPQFADKLVSRSIQLGLQRPLWYALTVARQWFGTPSPSDEGLRALRPPWPARSMVAALGRRCLAVTDPDAEPGALDRLCIAAMGLRAQWLRMPPWLLAYHAAVKWTRPRPRGTEDAVA